MRRLIVLVLTLALLWGGYWVIGSRAVQADYRHWFEAQRQAGWVAEFDSLATRGFPNRFDTVATGLELADPYSGLAWRAPEFQVLRLSYRPHHVIAIWPRQQTIASPLQRIEVDSEQMRASVVFEPGGYNALDRATLDLSGLKMTSSQGWSAAVARGLLATRQTPARPLTHDISFSAQDFTPPSKVLRGLARAELLPGEVERLSLEATVEFTAPWDQRAVEIARPQVRHLELKLLKATWGRLDLWMAGEVAVDDLGVPSGRIMVKAKNWTEMLDLAEAMGWIGPGTRATLESGLGLLAGLAGDPATLDVPLELAEGEIWLGPVSLGPAPRVLIR